MRAKQMLRLSLLGWLLILFFACSPVAAETTALVGGTLVDVNQGENLPGTVIVIVDGQVVAVGDAASVTVPTEARVIDFSGKWLIPGMIDTHVHFMESGKMAMDAMMRSLDPGLSEEEDVAWLKQRTAFTLSRYLCSGVTTVVSLGGPEHIEFGARELARTLDIAPRILIAGGPIGNSGFEWIFDGADAVFAADTEEEIRAKVRHFAALGADAIKLGFIGASLGSTTTFTPAEFAPVLAAATAEAHELGMPVLTHIMMREEAEALIDTGMDVFAHLPFDQPVSDGFIDDIIERDIVIAPTISVFPRMMDVLSERLVLNDIERSCGDPEVYEDYADYASGFRSSATMLVANLGLKFALGNARDAVADSVRRLHDAGARFIIGSDASHIGTPHGVAMHVELQMLEDVGLPPGALLQAATINAADVMGVSAQLGSIEPGKLADIVALDADPLETIRNVQRITHVIKGGQVLERAILATDIDDSKLVATHFRQQFLEVLLWLELACLLAVWVGWRFGPGFAFTRRLAQQIYDRKIEAMETSAPLKAYRRAIDEGRTSAGLTILSVLIGLKSLGAFVMGLVMVFWLPFATLFLMPGIVDAHDSGEGEKSRRVFARVTLMQVTSHAVAAALGFVLTRWWWASEVSLATSVVQNWLVLCAGLVVSMLFAVWAGWLELRAHVVHKLL
ncbi:amidohydrolase family protein [Candidatus Leptofilum sp.]|uniref:amidohydrolase family protein n=1 Tax=Candidatus Leptofilum sp. TaxID=3241576 RepID=UPI003B5CC500